MVNRVSRRSGEDVPVIGAVASGSGGGEPAGGRAPRAGRGVALVVAAALAVTAIVNLVGDEGSDPNPTDVSMALPPPVEPSVVTTAPVPEPPEFALGWKELGLPGYAAPSFGQVIDAGPSGWVAVTQGNVGQMVHTSRDGVGWRSTTLEEVGWSATVFSGTQGLFVAVSGGPGGAGIWHSSSGGIGWTRSRLPGDEVLVLSVAEAAGRVWAAGTTGRPPDPWAAGTPAVWVLEGEDWIPVALEGERGWVASVVEWEGGVWGFGADGGPVVWDLVGAERHEVSPDTGVGGFRMVVAHQRALWGLFTPGLDQPGRLFTSSPDPTEWEPVPGLSAPSGLTLESVGEQLALVDGSQRVLIVGEGPLSTRIPDHPTGRERAIEVAGLAVAGDQGAMLGFATTSEAMLWTRGTVSEPIVLLDPERVVWSARRELGAQIWGPMVIWDDRIFMVGESGVYEWVFGTDLVEVPGGREVFVLQPTEAGLLGLSLDGLRLLSGDEFDDFDSPPNPELCNATVIDGLLTVTDCAYGWYQRGADGEWSQREQTPFRVVGSLDGAFIAYDPATGELGVTVDGTNLEFRGQVERARTGQDPYVVLERRSDSATVRLINPWPGGVTFDVPTPAPLELTRVGDTLRVQSPSTLYTSTDQGRSWTEVPIGVENGFPQGGILLPTETLMVIAPKPGPGSVSVLYTLRS